MYRRCKNYSREDLVADILNIDWNNTLSPNKMDSNYSFDKFIEIVNSVLDKHMPWKKMNKKDFKLETKPWITPGILLSIKRRDKLLKKYISCPDGDKKNELHTQYKILRNKIVALIRLSKKKSLPNLFQPKFC